MRIEGTSNSRPIDPLTRDHVSSRDQTPRDPMQMEKRREVFDRKVLDENTMKEVREQLEAEIERLNRITRAFDRRMNFLLHERADKIFVQIIDMETDAVIREVPPEEVLDLIASIRDMVGIFLDMYV